MNDIRRTILWLIFGFSLISLWDQWKIYNGETPTFFPVASSTAPKADKPQAAANTEGTGVGESQGQIANQSNEAAQPGEKVEVRSDVLALTFDTEGGSVVRAELLRHQDLNADGKNGNFVLLRRDAEQLYVTQSGLIGGNYPNHKTAMRWVAAERELKPGSDELSIRFESPVIDGLQLIKTYTLKRASYVVDVRHDIVNVADTAKNAKLYLQIVRDGTQSEGGSSFYSTFTGPVVYTDAKKYQKVEFSDIDKNKVDIEKQSDSGYVAMVQHYFASAWLLDKGVHRELFANKLANNRYAVGMIAQEQKIEPGQKAELKSRLFVGPQEEKRLEQIAPGLELVKDYGWVTVLAKPLYWLLDKLNATIDNWGWSIVALVVLLKLAFYWLNAKAYASMAKMKAINPRITEMRERLKNNPQQMQQEMMRIYREEKVNPMGGCLPIMIQIPVFIALYWVLLSSVEMRNAPWILWITDLSVEDPYYILPLLMTLTTMLQTALNPAPPDPIQAKMMWLMPLVFSVMFFFFPAGLVLYWLTNNILSIAQQWVINTRLGVPPKFQLPKFR